MGKLIDSDDLKLLLKNLHLLATSGYGAEEVVGKILDEMPEGVVRCKDCALWNDGKCDTWSALGVTILAAETGYCNFGERRDDGS